ncbi:MAG: hypothetical protein WC942_07660 [Clostridia bacterium]|jgi:hypothetical protein
MDRISDTMNSSREPLTNYLEGVISILENTEQLVMDMDRKISGPKTLDLPEKGSPCSPPESILDLVLDIKQRARGLHEKLLEIKVVL